MSYTDYLDYNGRRIFETGYRHGKATAIDELVEVIIPKIKELTNSDDLVCWIRREARDIVEKRYEYE